MDTQRYRKKPVEIEAIQFARDGTNAEAIADWIANSSRMAVSYNMKGISIHTLEGVMLASPGDWVIKGVQGEFYPCKPDIFDATYDKV